MNEDYKYHLKPTSIFKKVVKRIIKRGYNLDLLDEVVITLAKGESLDSKYHDHALLGGDYKDCRECHIEPDWLLIYKKSEETLFLYQMRTGTHADLLSE